MYYISNKDRKLVTIKTSYLKTEPIEESDDKKDKNKASTK